MEELSLRLPSGKSGPLPSPWLLREDYISEKPSQLSAYSVPALGLAPGSAFDLLLDMPTHPPQGTAYADSMLFWSELAFLSLELVSREQFVPAIRKSRALWKAAIDEPDQERLNIFIRSLPPSCRGLSPLPPGSGSMATPSRLVQSFVNIAVDALVRTSLNGVSLQLVQRGRRPKHVPLPIQFLAALTSKETGLSASAPELVSFSLKMDSWTAQIHPKIEAMPSRLTRGKSYARKGQVISIDVKPGVVKARVQGSFPKPYDVSIKLVPLSPEEWDRAIAAMASKAVFSARLLSGEMPQTIEEAFSDCGISLFPKKGADLKTDCSCPDWSNHCKHIAAVYYLLAEQFDRDPFLIFKLRGRSKEEIVEALRGRKKNPSALALPTRSQSPSLRIRPSLWKSV